jgi:hypothetical protein
VVPKMLKTPPRGGVRVSVHVATCGCGDAAHTSSSFSLDDDEDEEKQDDEEAQERARSRPPVLFSYDEAIVKQVRAGAVSTFPKPTFDAVDPAARLFSAVRPSLRDGRCCGVMGVLFLRRRRRCCVGCRSRCRTCR